MGYLGHDPELWNRHGGRRQAQEQYAQMGDLLAAAAHAPAEEPTGPVGYRVSSALRPKEGQQLCGDQLATVETGGMLYLLLSDGMGSGRRPTGRRR